MGLFVSIALPGDPEHGEPRTEVFHKQGGSSQPWPTLAHSTAPPAQGPRGLLCGEGWGRWDGDTQALTAPLFLKAGGQPRCGSLRSCPCRACGVASEGLPSQEGGPSCLGHEHRFPGRRGLGHEHRFPGRGPHHSACGPLSAASPWPSRGGSWFEFNQSPAEPQAWWPVRSSGPTPHDGRGLVHTQTGQDASPGASHVRDTPACPVLTSLRKRALPAGGGGGHIAPTSRAPPPISASQALGEEAGAPQRLRSREGCLAPLGGG